MGKVADFIFGAPKSLQVVFAAMKLKDAFFGRKVMINLDTMLKSRERYYFANKGPSSQGYGFSSSHEWMQSWTIKKAEC